MVWGALPGQQEEQSRPGDPGGHAGWEPLPLAPDKSHTLISSNLGGWDGHTPHLQVQGQG